MKLTTHVLHPCLLTLMMCVPALAWGSSIGELQASGQLRVDSTLAPVAAVVPGQKVMLTLEIATDRWFSGGTRIGVPEVPGLVILQTEQFASNASETRNGQTWVIQRWTLDIFPQRAGKFTVGPIPLQVQVNTGDGGDVKGELLSPAQSLSVVIPDQLAQAELWVAAPSFTVRQNFDRTLDDLVVGDALEQEVLFEASDVLAMMLPTYEIEQQEGLAAYPSPPVLDNSTNRGETTASSSMRISYVVEQAGQYLLPARDYFWWNTRSAELELLSLPETRITVGGAGTPAEATPFAFSVSPGQWVVLAIGLALTAIAVRLAYTYGPRLPLAAGVAYLSKLGRRWRRLRKPALGTRLNPGSSAED